MVNFSLEIKFGVLKFAIKFSIYNCIRYFIQFTSTLESVSKNMLSKKMFLSVVLMNMRVSLDFLRSWNFGLQKEHI